MQHMLRYIALPLICVSIHVPRLHGETAPSPQDIAEKIKVAALEQRLQENPNAFVGRSEKDRQELFGLITKHKGLIIADRYRAAETHGIYGKALPVILTQVQPLFKAISNTGEGAMNLANRILPQQIATHTKEPHARNTSIPPDLKSAPSQTEKTVPPPLNTAPKPDSPDSELLHKVMKQMREVWKIMGQ